MMPRNWVVISPDQPNKWEGERAWQGVNISVPAAAWPSPEHHGWGKVGRNHNPRTAELPPPARLHFMPDPNLRSNLTSVLLKGAGIQGESSKAGRRTQGKALHRPLAATYSWSRRRHQFRSFCPRLLPSSKIYCRHWAFLCSLCTEITEDTSNILPRYLLLERPPTLLHKQHLKWKSSHFKLLDAELILSRQPKCAQPTLLLLEIKVIQHLQ